MAFPFVTLVMTLLAVPFGVGAGRRGALYGIGLGIVIALSYWILISAFVAIGQRGLLIPWLAGGPRTSSSLARGLPLPLDGESLDLIVIAGERSSSAATRSQARTCLVGLAQLAFGNLADDRTTHLCCASKRPDTPPAASFRSRAVGVLHGVRVDQFLRDSALPAGVRFQHADGHRHPALHSKQLDIAKTHRLVG